MKQMRPRTITMRKVTDGMRPGTPKDAPRPTAEQRFIEALPEDVYGPCPCGCGKAWKYVKQAGAATIREHMAAHAARRIANLVAVMTLEHAASCAAGRDNAAKKCGCGPEHT